MPGADTPQEFDGVGLDLHPGAPAMAGHSPTELPVHILGDHRQARRDPLEDCDQSLAVRFTGGGKLDQWKRSAVSGQRSGFSIQHSTFYIHDSVPFPLSPFPFYNSSTASRRAKQEARPLGRAPIASRLAGTGLVRRAPGRRRVGIDDRWKLNVEDSSGRHPDEHLLSTSSLRDP